MAAAAVAQQAVSDASRDALSLLLFTRLRDGRWLTAKRAAKLSTLRNEAVRLISDAIVSAFLEHASNIENERGRSVSVQDVLFAPKLQTTSITALHLLVPVCSDSQDSHER